MRFIKRKQVEKESNVARTPTGTEKVRSRPAAYKVLFFIWNILSISLYCAYTLFVTYKLSEKTFLSSIIFYLLAVYALSFVILIILGLFSKKKMKYHLKNYKSAVKFFKYAIQIINFVLSIVTAISALITTGTTDYSAVMFAILSLAITIFLILFEIAKIIVRKNLPLIRYNFLEIRDKVDEKAEKKSRKKQDLN